MRLPCGTLRTFPRVSSACLYAPSDRNISSKCGAIYSYAIVLVQQVTLGACPRLIHVLFLTSHTSEDNTLQNTGRPAATTTVVVKYSSSTVEQVTVTCWINADVAPQNAYYNICLSVYELYEECLLFFLGSFCVLISTGMPHVTNALLAASYQHVRVADGGCRPNAPRFQPQEPER